MNTDWDVKKAEELCRAMQACQSLDKLNDIARGIAFLSPKVLSDERRAWLRDIYSSCKSSLTAKPYTDEHLTKKGKHADLYMSENGEADTKAKSDGQVHPKRPDAGREGEGLSKA